MKKLVELFDIKEEEVKPDYKIYCDMDGVLTNFEERFLSKLKEEGNKYYSRKDLESINKPKDFESKFGLQEFWKFIDEYIGVSFWVGMGWMPNGQALWNFISPYSPTLLTSPSRNNVSRLGKNLWVRNNLTPKPRVIFAYSKDKQTYANEKSILIDDKPSNISEWMSKGGIALECKDGNIAPIIKELKNLGYQ